jgi:serine/threonine-protein kinase
LISTKTLLTNRYWLDQRVIPHLTREAWRARDLATGRAVTVWRPGASPAANVECFLAEVEETVRIRHPAVARILDFGVAEPDGVPFAVTEPADGPSLAAIMQAGPLDPPWVLDIVRQVASALSEVEGRGLRLAVNPWSLRLAPGGAVQIGGFDLRQEADRRADDPGESLYRLGLVAWACLSGESPTVGTWQDKSLAGYVRQPATPLPSLPDTVPPGIAVLAADLTTAGSPARRGGAAHVVARCGELLATPMRTRQPGRSSGPGETSLLDTLDGELRCA